MLFKLTNFFDKFKRKHQHEVDGCTILQQIARYFPWIYGYHKEKYEETWLHDRFGTIPYALKKYHIFYLWLILLKNICSYYWLISIMLFFDKDFWKKYHFSTLPTTKELGSTMYASCRDQMKFARHGHCEAQMWMHAVFVLLLTIVLPMLLLLSSGVSF